jgi:adenylate cyclase
VASSRRLAAIMFTDMVGFTQGAQRDERGTLERLAEQESLVRPLVARHEGREVKSTGDGLLVEFPSALKAAECAVAIQERLRDRNRAHAEAPIELRIGIHLGDVEDRGGDIFGDAVNVASRVQPAAEAGGIAISQQVFDQVRNKLPLPIEPMAPRALKGVESPTTIFRIVLPWQGAPAAGGSGAAGGDRLAVLPFANISPDPRDAYFSDGLTEEVISALSELPGLRVIARTSVDPYRATPRPVAQVGAELGVRWVLEGSVRKDGSRLRFTAQLVDATTQVRVWAGKYDRELVDLFALQSELARQIADALQLKLLSESPGRTGRRRAPEPESYLEYLQGRSQLRDLTEGSLRSAEEHFRRAIALDDANAFAYAGLAETIGFLSGIYRTIPREAAEAETRHLAARALELAPDLAEAHTIAALDRLDEYDYPAALEGLRRAIALNPSYAGAHLYYGALLANLRRPEEGLREYRLAGQLDPLSGLPIAEEALLLTYLRRLAEARERLARLGEVEKHGILWRDRSGLYELVAGNVAGFRAHIEWFKSHMPDRPEFLTAEALCEVAEGHPARARDLLVRAMGLPEAVRPTSGIAAVYAHLGDLDACFRWIDKAITERRFTPRAWLYDPQFERVRADPRFAAVLRRVHVPEG